MGVGHGGGGIRKGMGWVGRKGMGWGGRRGRDGDYSRGRGGVWWVGHSGVGGAGQGGRCRAGGQGGRGRAGWEGWCMEWGYGVGGTVRDLPILLYCHPLLLPELDFNFTKPATNQANRLKLNNVPLDEIRTTYRQMDAMQTITLEDIEKASSTNWTLWTTIIIIIILLVSYFCYKIWKFNNGKAPEIKLKLETENRKAVESTPSVLFNPEVVS